MLYWAVEQFIRQISCLFIAVHYTCNIDWASYHDDDDDINSWFCNINQEDNIDQDQENWWGFHDYTDGTSLKAFMILLMLSLNLTACWSQLAIMDYYNQANASQIS